MKRSEFTKFSHKQNLHSSLHGGSLAVHTYNITFNSTEVITLITKFIILYTISKKLVPKDKSEVKITIPEGTNTSHQFKVNQCLALEIKDYKLVIPENFTFTALKTLFDALEIKQS